MDKKIAFFDIDGTLTSEIDGSIPSSAITAIKKARENGHLMFINTGRCFQNVEPRFRNIGFDGYVCGCGTHLVLDNGDNTYNDVLYVSQSAEIIHKILNAARNVNVDILFESRYLVVFDHTRPLLHPAAIRQNNSFLAKGYPMNEDIDNPEFTCDKFVIWYSNASQLEEFRKTSDKYFECIDRGGNFREFVPFGYSKATGIQKLLDYYHLPLENTYALGDSNNDLAMLSYVPNSIAMGNSEPETLKNKVAFVTDNASCDGIYHALLEHGFI